MKDLGQFREMMDIGLNKSIDMVISLTRTPSDSQRILRAFSLINMKRYNEALKSVENIQLSLIPHDLANDLIEIRLVCYLNTNNAAKSATIIHSKDFSSRELTPKIHLLAARALMLNDPTPRLDHPAINHLTRVLEKYPYAIELIDKLVMIGAKVLDILSIMPNEIIKHYVVAIDHGNRGQFREAIDHLKKITEEIPNCVPALIKICVYAISCDDIELFDATSSLLPLDDLEIVDLRAARLKQQKKKFELNQLVCAALNANEGSATAWIAFSHHLELNGDIQRAIVATKKALLLDNNSRRGYMRHGELRLLQNDIFKAQSSFAKAHIIYQGIDSFSALVHCHCSLKNWYEAESIASAAIHKYAQDGDARLTAFTLYGLAKRGTDLKKAKEILIRSLDMKGDNIEALGALADILLKDNNFDAVEQLLNKYKSSKTLFFYNYKIAELYSIKRDFTTAMGFAQNAMLLEPNNDRARELLDQLEGILRDNEELIEEDEEDP